MQKPGSMFQVQNDATTQRKGTITGSRTRQDEARRVVPFLRRLARQGVCARRQSSDPRDAGEWRIVSVPQSKPALPVHDHRSGNDASSGAAGAPEHSRRPHAGDDASSPVYPADLVQAALSAGLVEIKGDHLTLSTSGAAFLRRAQSEADDPFAAQHQMRGRSRLDDGSNVTVNECESPLGWLRSRKDPRTGKAMISQPQFEAGERLRQDFTRAQMSARVTADWSAALSGGRSRRSGGGDKVDICDAALSARARYYAALDAVGEELSDVLVWVCCEGRGLRDVERSAGWPQRSGKLMLQTALQALARHYGLEPSRRQGSARSRVTHWGADDYRPAAFEPEPDAERP